MKHIFFLAFLLASCQTIHKPNTVTVVTHAPVAQEEPDFVSKHGIKVWAYDLPVTRDKFELATEVFLLGLSLKGVDYEIAVKAIASTYVEWTNERIAIAGVPTGAGGVKIGRQITVQWTGSVSSSSLFHEWLHTVLFALVRTADADHTSLWWRDWIPEIKKLAADAGS